MLELANEHPDRDHQQGAGQDRPQYGIRRPAAEDAADDDTRDRAGEQRQHESNIHRAHHPMAKAGDQRQRNGVGNVACGNPGDGQARRSRASTSKQTLEIRY